MAGVFAVRALRAGREKFDPFREISSDEEDDTNVDDMKGGGLPGDDDDTVAAPAGAAFSSTKLPQSRWEKDAADKNADAAFDVTDESSPAATAPPPQKPITPLAPSWETPCELLYEDDDAEVFCVRFNPEDKLLAAGCGDSVVRIFHCDDGRLAYNLDSENTKTRLPTTCLRWRPAAANAATKNILLTANADGTICHWHVTSRKCLHTVKEDDCQKPGATNQVYALDYNPDGTSFASAGKDYCVRVYDEATKTVTSMLKAGHVGAPSAGHSNRIFGVKFVPDDPMLLLSAGWDNTVQVWDLRTSQPCASMYGPHICGDSLDASGFEVVTGSWRPKDQLQIWDRRNCELAVEVPFSAGRGQDACHLYAAQFSKASAAGPQLVAAGGSVSNELKLFKRSNLEPVGRLGLPRGVYGLDMSHDGTSLAVAGGDCKVRVMKIPSGTGEAAVTAKMAATTVESKENDPVALA